MTATPAMMRDARAKTLAFVRAFDDEAMTAWPDAEFSPLCWHLGHIAFTEAHWALWVVLGDGSFSAPHAIRYAQDGCDKAKRAAGYDRGALLHYLDDVRAELEARWSSIEHQRLTSSYLDWFLACHEHQHRETMALVASLLGGDVCEAPCPALQDDGPAGRLELGGAFVLGTDHPLEYDNARPAMPIDLPKFTVDAHPVTSAAYAIFIEAGGYADRAIWSDEGWAWRVANAVEAPRGWRTEGRGWSRRGPFGRVPVVGGEPVFGVSAHEADAFAHRQGGTLPSEAEWEALAQSVSGAAFCGDENGPRSGPRPVEPVEALGNVWEWTSSPFEARPQFDPFPYRGYSAPYFDGAHRVMRGGSFATDPAIATSRFRNWYTPETRQTFTGFRVRY